MHPRSGNNLSAHPEAVGIIWQASGFQRFDESPDLASLCLRSSLTTLGIWQVKTKLPHRVGEMGHPRRRFCRNRDIWPTRNTQP